MRWSGWIFAGNTQTEAFGTPVAYAVKGNGKSGGKDVSASAGVEHGTEDEGILRQARCA